MVPNTLIRESFALFAKVTCTCLFAKVSSNCFFTNENEINRLSLQRVWFFYHLFFWASLFRLYSISTNEGITKKIIGITFKFETFNLDYHFYMYFRTLYGDFYQSKQKCNASLSCLAFLFFDEKAKKKKIIKSTSKFT